MRTLSATLTLRGGPSQSLASASKGSSSSIVWVPSSASSSSREGGGEGTPVAAMGRRGVSSAVSVAAEAAESTERELDPLHAPVGGDQVFFCVFYLIFCGCFLFFRFLIS
jgi:hypothetical protein